MTLDPNRKRMAVPAGMKVLPAGAVVRWVGNEGDMMPGDIRTIAGLAGPEGNVDSLLVLLVPRYKGDTKMNNKWLIIFDGKMDSDWELVSLPGISESPPTTNPWSAAFSPPGMKEAVQKTQVQLGHDPGEPIFFPLLASIPYKPLGPSGHILDVQPFCIYSKGNAQDAYTLSPGFAEKMKAAKAANDLQRQDVVCGGPKPTPAFVCAKCGTGITCACCQNEAIMKDFWSDPKAYAEERAIWSIAKSTGLGTDIASGAVDRLRMAQETFIERLAGSEAGDWARSSFVEAVRAAAENLSAAANP